MSIQEYEKILQDIDELENLLSKKHPDNPAAAESINNLRDIFGGSAQKRQKDAEKILPFLDEEFPGAGSGYIEITVCDSNKTKEEIALAISYSGMDPEGIFSGHVDNLGHRTFCTWEDNFNVERFTRLEDCLDCPIIANAVWENFWDSSLRNDKTVIEKYRTQSDGENWSIADVIHYDGKKIAISYDCVSLTQQELDERKEISLEEFCEVEKSKFYPKTKEELKALCKDESIYLGDIDTSLITDMSYLFAHSARKDFRGIETWDTSNVTDMSYMFCLAEKFNQPIGTWDTSNVENMRWMFFGALNFNQDISRWDVSNVTDMSYMFANAENFNQPLDRWDTSNVTDMSFMFEGAETFNQPIGGWDVSNVTDMSGMFHGAKEFNQEISNWDISKVKDKSIMFSKCNINPEFTPHNYSKKKNKDKQHGGR